MTHRLTACLAITAILVARLPAAIAIIDPPQTFARNHLLDSP